MRHLHRNRNYKCFDCRHRFIATGACHSKKFIESLNSVIKRWFSVKRLFAMLVATKRCMLRLEDETILQIDPSVL